MRKFIIFSLLLSACGGAAKTGSSPTGPTTGPTSEMTPTTQPTQAGTALASTGSGAAATPDFSCSGVNIVDASGSQQAACNGPVFNTCDSCPLNNGVSCLSTSPICEGEVTVPSGESFAFTDNGCNTIGCTAFTSHGTLYIELVTPGGNFSLSVPKIATAQPFQSSASYKFTNGNATGIGMNTLQVATSGGVTAGSKFSLALNGSFPDQDNVTQTFDIKLSGLVTEAK